MKMEVYLHPASLAKITEGIKTWGIVLTKNQYVVTFDEKNQGEGFELSYKRLFGKTPIGPVVYVEKFFGTLDDVNREIEALEG